MTALQSPPRTMPSTARAALPSDDRALVLAHLDGVEEAFELLYERYQPRLVSFLRARLGDRSAAEDLAQETFIRAMGGLHRFDPDRPLWPWLRRIATNAVIDAARARTRADALAAALASTPALDAVEQTPDLGERELLLEALQQVPERQRSALHMCYVEGWRPVDVADQFGVGSNAFEQLLHRARRNLRRAYTDRSEGDRAAGAAWLLPLVALLTRPVTAVADRARRTLAGVPHLPEAMVATLALATVVALVPEPQPAPRTLVPPRPADAVVAPADEPPAGPATVLDAAAPAPDLGGPPQAVPEAPASGVGRPAPVGVERPARAQEDALPIPVDPPRIELESSSGGPEPAEDPVSAPPDPVEALGGCGSVTRDAVCTAVGALAG